MMVPANIGGHGQSFWAGFVGKEAVGRVGPPRDPGRIFLLIEYLYKKYSPWLVFSLIGLWIAIREGRRDPDQRWKWVLLASWAALPIIGLLFNRLPFGRYLYHTYPALAIFSAVGLVHLGRRWFRPHHAGIVLLIVTLGAPIFAQVTSPRPRDRRLNALVVVVREGGEVTESDRD